MKIFIFGSTGMLGTYIFKLLNTCYKVKIFGRSDYDILNDNWEKINILLKNCKEDDVVINCIGIIPQKINTQEYKKFIKINTLFPHKLYEIVNKYNAKLIHITTNCVFDGKRGKYIETDEPNDTTIYGITKLLGEVKNCTNIRTSIIGHENFEKKSLLEWIISRKNLSINGYTNHYWNGVTCLTLANIIKYIIKNNLYWKGIRHIFSPNTVSKYELCCIINKVYNLNIKINKFKTQTQKNHTLNSLFDNDIFKISNIEQQVIEQKNFKLCSIGKYNNLKSCRVCNSVLNDIFSFTTPLAGGFISEKKNVIYENIYPATLSFCNNCKTGQIKEVIEKNLLFKNINNNKYFYYSSTIPYLCNHFNKLTNIIINTYNPKNILEIGCNDGVLLNQIYDKKNNIICVGVDPSETIKKIINPNIKKYNNFFNDNIYTELLKNHGKFDIITSSNCLAHMNNIDVIFKNIKKLLKDDGTVIIEVHYFKNIIDKLNFDFIYHEHMSYYTINSFVQIAKKFKFNIHNIEFIKIHGGSIRVYMKHYKNNYINPSLNKLLNNEKHIEKNINMLYENINIWKKKILNILYIEKNKNNYIYGYGASGRTNTILAFIDFNFDYIFDDSKYKINNYTPYYHTKILDSQDIYSIHDIKTIFILAWPYSKDIIKKHIQFLNNGGKFIIILPNIQIITLHNYKLFID